MKTSIATNKDRILSILKAIDRPGMDRVIDYICNDCNYFTANCNGHHFIGRGGVAQHSLEVMDHILPLSSPVTPRESLIIVSLFHDFGKSTNKSGIRFRRGIDHGSRSVDILDYCGFELTDDERFAIANHHNHDRRTYLNPLRFLLTNGDCFSTGNWKRAHPEEVEARKRRRHSHR